MTSRTTTLSIKRLQDVADDGLSGPTTPATRLALVEILTREAFAVAGAPAAAYPRHEAPVVVRPLRSSQPAIRR